MTDKETKSEPRSRLPAHYHVPSRAHAEHIPDAEAERLYELDFRHRHIQPESPK